MSSRNAYYSSGGTSSNAGSPCRHENRYLKYIKPLAFFVVTSMLAMSVSHMCDKYSASSSFQVIKNDLNNLKAHISLLSMELKTVLESRDSDLKSKLKEVGCAIPKMSEAINSLRNEVTEGCGSSSVANGMSTESMRRLIKSELETYDADKTGKTDYALELSGGHILSTRDTETHPDGAPSLKIFGIPLCQQQHTPRAIIQSGVLPGECWPFKGSKGCVVIQLIAPIIITGITLEHISPRISPTGEISSAPKDFSVYALECVDDDNGFLLGKFTYDITKSAVQYFEVQDKPTRPYDIVELKIHSNNGDSYTCVYRLRVHGSRK